MSCDNTRLPNWRVQCVVNYSRLGWDSGTFWQSENSDMFVVSMFTAASSKFDKMARCVAPGYKGTKLLTRSIV